MTAVLVGAGGHKMYSHSEREEKRAHIAHKVKKCLRNLKAKNVGWRERAGGCEKAKGGWVV